MATTGMNWTIGQKVRCDRQGLEARITSRHATRWGTYVTLYNPQTRYSQSSSIETLQQQGWNPESPLPDGVASQATFIEERLLID